MLNQISVMRYFYFMLVYNILNPRVSMVTQIYAFTANFVPTLAILATTNSTPPANMVTPANIIADVYSPLSCEISAPEIGVPVNTAKLMILKLIPSAGWDLT